MLTVRSRVPTLMEAHRGVALLKMVSICLWGMSWYSLDSGGCIRTKEGGK